MIYFDVTKTGSASHRSGLMRVSVRLRESLGPAATEIAWDAASRRFKGLEPAARRTSDWMLTSELFSEEERPGFGAFLAARPCRAAAIFHDAIPLKHPHITWPQSVARHPAYLKLLAQFDRVWAVSQASRDELLGFWAWQGIESPPPVEVLALGADFGSTPRQTPPRPASAGPPQLVSVGIIEPRKNQAFLLDVCEELWAEGARFVLHIVGRVNPHFGRPIEQRIRAVQRKHPDALKFHERANDETLRRLHAMARATVFTTIAEGCGLPLLESLWLGVPCVCSDLAVLRENAAHGGCLLAAPNDRAAWKTALRQILQDDAAYSRLSTEAMSRSLPTWDAAAETLAAALQ